MNTTLSLARSYSENVANDLIKIRNYAIKHGHKNTFLDYISKYVDDYGVTRLSFKGGVNLNSSDVELIVKGFNNLSRYEIVDGEVVYDAHKIVSESPIQKALLNYAILNYGLQFSSSNFSNYISANHLKEIDEEYNSKLEKLVSSLENNDGVYIPGLVNQFQLIYAVMQGNRLPFVAREKFAPYYEKTINTADGQKTERVYQGADMVTHLETASRRKVFYDRRVKLDEDQKPLSYIKVSYNNRTSIYKLMVYTRKYAYYQIVGKTSDIFYTPIPETDFYGKPITYYAFYDYFNPFEFTLKYSDISKDLAAIAVGDEIKVTSMTGIESDKRGEMFINVGDEFWISAAYNADRLDRIRVKLLAKPSTGGGNKKGFIYKVQVVEPNNIKQRRSAPGSRISYLSYFTREDVIDDNESVYLFADNIEGKGRIGNDTSLRGLPNAIAIPTKKKVGTKKDSFFSDDEAESNKLLIDAAFELIPKDKKVVVSSLSLGMALDDLSEVAPLTSEYIKFKLRELNNIPVTQLTDEKNLLEDLENNCNIDVV